VKIGLIIYGSLDTLSGGYLYDRQLVAHLRANGCEVEILSLPWRNYPLHLSDNLHLGWARKIADARYDLLLQDELNHPSLFLLNSLLRRQCTCPTITIVHHLRSSEDHPAALLPFYRAIERQYLTTVDGYIFNSQTTKQIVHQLLGHSVPHVVAYPAVDHLQLPTHSTVVSAITERLQRHAPLQLLFVGNLMARKRLHTVLQALADLKQRNWQLHIVGSQAIDPHYSTEMHHLASTLALAPHLTWHGRISDEELTKLYSTSDCLVMPSYEGFGIVYLEAMAHGLPVIAATAGAAHEIVQPGKNGYLIPLDDNMTLAHHLERIQTNRVHLATLAFHARQSFEAHPTWQASMQAAYQWLYELSKRAYTE
jgi:glycosyltransferase involved in cell wall biosynthesis